MYPRHLQRDEKKILKDLIGHFDRALPSGDDWHIQLLRRAKYPNEGVRPAVISEETFISLDTLRGFRHVFRGKYHTNLIPELILERANETLTAYPRFLKDIERLQASMQQMEGE